MDSRELHLQQQQQQQQQHHQQQQQQQQHQHHQLQPPSMLMGSYNRNPNTGLMGPTSTSQSMHHPHHPHLNQNRGLPFQYHHQMVDQKPLGFEGFDGSPTNQQQQAVRFGIESSSPQSQQQQQQAAAAKKKRGRPRKYAPDGNIALGLAPTSPLPSASNSYGGGEGGGNGGGGDSGGGGVNVNNSSSDPPAKRNRGRPPGSGKKQLDALGGTGGVGFTPHVIEVQIGEDIALKVKAFSNQGPRAICILSATGAVSSAVLTKGGNNGPVKCEGPYEIISLSGSFLNSDSGPKAGGLSVSLARPDGVIVGGTVTGTLVAGSPVQVIVGSFVADGKKQKQNTPARAQNTPEPASAPANMLSFGGGGGNGPGSPRSQGQQHSSESSEGNESHSPMHRGNNNTNNNNNNHGGLFGNSMPPQALHQMPPGMTMFWAAQNPQ